MTSNENAFRIIVADSTQIALRGLSAIIESKGPYRVVGASSEGGECLELIASEAPEIAIVAASLPGLSGWEVLAGIFAKHLPTRLVLLAETESESQACAALSAGAYGFLIRSTAHLDMHDCLSGVASGTKWAPPISYCPPWGAWARFAVRPPEQANLTSREREITTLAALGLTNKRIARRLGVSDGTVRIHLHNIFRKLRVSNRTELAQRAHPSALSAPPVVNRASDD